MQRTSNEHRRDTETKGVTMRCWVQDSHREGRPCGVENGTHPTLLSGANAQTQGEPGHPPWGQPAPHSPPQPLSWGRKRGLTAGTLTSR